MGGSTGNVAGTGVTRAHTWGLIVPLLAAISPLWLSKYVHVSNHQPINALAAGVVVATVAYILFTYVPQLREKHHILAKAILAGLLVAEIMVVKPHGSLPSMGTITLWLFFWYHTVEGI